MEKSIQIGEVTLRYAEGPANGPPLLLLHAQHMDWFSYSRVLPELSRSFHVFAVSYHGHGTSTGSAERMDAADIGADLSTFIETVAQEPVFITGNSSGALLSVWLAANRPAWIRAVLLEDPPLFTAELPRLTKTVAYRSFATCHGFLEAGMSDDFLLYWLEANRQFVINQAGENGLALLVDSIKSYRAAHPGERVELNNLPDTLRLLIRGLDVYDPHFGDAFYDGRWNENFDHAAALQRIDARTLLLHANFSYLPDGTLDGALDDADAERVLSLLRNGSYLKIDAAHVVHLDKPSEFVAIARRSFLGE
ncbi:MAG TPA: alpha/beta hydrolase [Polyangiaceae bacterium]|nr:alpha/beta hydrolase [Polyangiaceae bacterium]